MLRKETTSTELFAVLEYLMEMPELANFRLVGGTALSLIQGHRHSVDIDLFTNSNYSEIPFKDIASKLKEAFPYFDDYTYNHFPSIHQQVNNYGLHLYVGYSEADPIKLDILYWNAEFIFPPLVIDNIRLATVQEIALMKLDAISRGGRKKDFYDLSEIFEYHSIESLLELYPKKYPYLSIDDVIKGLDDFSIADEMPDPVCLRGRYWEVVQQEFREIAQKVRS